MNVLRRHKVLVRSPSELVGIDIEKNTKGDEKLRFQT